MKQIFKVAKDLVAVAAACVVVLFALSCEKRGVIEIESGEEESLLMVSIVSNTKSEEPLPEQADNNKVNMLEIFVFRADGDDAGVLDAYKKISGDELVSLTGIQMRTTTGKKVIYAVVNSHNEDWSSVKSLADFQQMQASLQKEDEEDLTMVGYVEQTLQVTTSVTIPVSRLVAKIRMRIIAADFRGTPYEGMPLKNVKVYLTNVYGKKSYASGTDGNSVAILNNKGLSTTDVEGCKNGGMLFFEHTKDVTHVNYDLDHSFYCYENMIESESDQTKFTRLVIEGELNGKKYYYPININRDGFGYTSEYDHVGVRRNTLYLLNVTICRPGSTDPDEVLEYGTLTTSVSIEDWIVMPFVGVEF